MEDISILKEESAVLDSLIRAFASAKGLTVRQSYRYLKRFGAIDMITTKWRSLKNAGKEDVNKLADFCRAKGGAIK